MPSRPDAPTVIFGRAIQVAPIGDHTKADIRHLLLGEPEVCNQGVEGNGSSLAANGRQLNSASGVLWQQSAELIVKSVAAK